MKPKGPALGDDAVQVPDPVTEEPPADRFCDLVMTGGVASGVVYPWAVVELARSFRFKSIGGTSVGAMAAALTAAAEYGRRCGHRHAFEVLRRLPGELAEDAGGGRTRLLALFQPSPHGQRLFDCFVDAVRIFAGTAPATTRGKWAWAGRTLLRFRWEALWACFQAVLLWTVYNAAIVGWLALLKLPHHGWAWALALPAIALAAGAVGVLLAVRSDIQRGLINHDLGLVRGATQPGRDRHDDPGLMDWLHKGIQLSAGLEEDGPPLTFRDLWRAPLFPGAPHASGEECDARGRRSINLEMVTTNVTHGRPYRLPLDDESSQLYFVPEELGLFLPASVMRALMANAEPYRPASPGDPAVKARRPTRHYKLPEADLPIVVAARLSLSFPVLFSTVPLYAVDYETPRGRGRRLKRCRFSDGGLSSNFPIHLFDAAVPRHPTFGLWLDKRNPHPAYADEAVWLPEHHGHGRGDMWQRFEPDDPLTVPKGWPPTGTWGKLGGFLLAAALSSKNWGDRSAMRMPQVRNRVARLYLLPGEGELNIAMPRQTLLKMAERYGTAAGLRFVERFAAAPGQPPRAAWSGHQWVRLHVLVASLREMAAGLAAASRHGAHTTPLRRLIELATQGRPLQPHARQEGDPRAPEPDPPGEGISQAQREALASALEAIEALEDAFARNRPEPPWPYRPVPTPSLRVRPPL